MFKGDADSMVCGDDTYVPESSPCKNDEDRDGIGDEVGIRRVGSGGTSRV